MKKLYTCLLLTMALTACGVDKSHPKYDQLRYDELQKANCNDMAYVLSAPMFMEAPEEFEAAYKRCRDTQDLSFEEYQSLAEHGRRTGAWDIYAVYPEKRDAPLDEKSDQDGESQTQ